MRGRILAIGIGNPLRGEDGVGPAVVERLTSCQDAHRVTAVSVPQLLPEHCDLLAGIECVVFLDASVSLCPQEVRLTRLRPDDADAPFTHHCTPAALLSLARAVSGHAPAAWQVEIGVESFEGQCVLSDELMLQVERCIKQILESVNAAPAERLDA